LNSDSDSGRLPNMLHAVRRQGLRQRGPHEGRTPRAGEGSQPMQALGKESMRTHANLPVLNCCDLSQEDGALEGGRESSNNFVVPHPDHSQHSIICEVTDAREPVDLPPDMHGEGKGQHGGCVWQLPTSPGDADSPQCPASLTTRIQGHLQCRRGGWVSYGQRASTGRGGPRMICLLKNPSRRLLVSSRSASRLLVFLPPPVHSVVGTCRRVEGQQGSVRRGQQGESSMYGR
jgi:hypothetical protein